MTSGPMLSTMVGAGGQGIERPDGTFLVIHGEHSIHTTIYQPDSNTVVAGPDFPVGAKVWNGAVTLQRCEGTYLIFQGNSTADSYIYDPVKNTFEPGPAASGAIELGSHILQSSLDGSYLIVHGGYGGSPATSTYDAGCPVTGRYDSEPMGGTLVARFVAFG